MTHYHPKPDDHGRKVAIHQPSTASAPSAWTNPLEAAAVVPGGPMPAEINGVAVHPWRDVPTHPGAWASLAARNAVPEPAFVRPSGLKSAAGVVVVEPDDRVWLVSPSNGYAGYSTTFPKGTVDAKASLQATAIKEAFEESGLRVELVGFLVDVRRSLSYTRYYLAKRTGGSPADMGWESQCVRLVPRAAVADWLTNANDAPVIAALHAMAR